jgi:hypothetical protein
MVEYLHYYQLKIDTQRRFAHTKSTKKLLCAPLLKKIISKPETNKLSLCVYDKPSSTNKGCVIETKGLPLPILAFFLPEIMTK